MKAKSDVEDIFVDYTEDGSLEQILADISSKSLRKVKDVEEFYQNIPVPMDIMTALDELEDKDAINIHADDTIDTTRFGRAVAMSFLSVDDGVIIKDSINDPKYLSYYYNKPFFKTVIIKDSINDPKYLSYYYNKPFFKTNLKELRLLSEKIDESNENALKKNKKIKNKSKSKDSSKKDKKDKKDKKETKEKDKKDNKKKNKSKKDKKNKNKSHKSKENKIKEKPIKPKEDKPNESQDNESSGIKFIVEEDKDEKPVPKKETKKESKTSKYIDNIADYFNGLNKSKDYKSSNNDAD